MSISTNSDLELLEASQAGQLDAFGGIVGRYQPLVSAVSFSATGDSAMAEDVAQETFLTAWSQIDSIREPSKLRAWLCGIARNLALASLRRSGREIATTDSEIAEISPTVQESPLDAALSQESEALVWAALQRIPDLYRVPIVMHYRESRSIPEIAESLGITRSTVQQRLSRGRNHMRQGVTDLVERTLSQHKPTKGFVAGIMGMITAGVAPTGAHASRSATELKATTAAIGSTGAMSMLMKVLLGSVLLGGTAITAVTLASGTDASDERAQTTTERADDERAQTTTERADDEDSSRTGVSNTRQDRPPALAPSLTVGADSTEALNVGDLQDNVVSYLVKVDGRLADDDLGIPDELSSCVVDGIEATTTVNIQWSVSTPDIISDIVVDHPYSDLAAVTACVKREVPKLELAPGKHRLQASIWVVPEAPQPAAGTTNAISQPVAQSRGPQDAPITIVQFSDFNCPYSGRLIGTLDALFEEYPDKLRVVVKQTYPSEESRLGARAAFAASAQGAYWPMHDRLFQTQGAHARDDVVRYALELGLDVARFEVDLGSEETSQLLAADWAEASALGVAATPTLVINGVRVRGALNIQMYRDRFDMILGAE